MATAGVAALLVELRTVGGLDVTVAIFLRCLPSGATASLRLAGGIHRQFGQFLWHGQIEDLLLSLLNALQAVLARSLCRHTASAGRSSSVSWILGAASGSRCTSGCCAIRCLLLLLRRSVARVVTKAGTWQNTNHLV